MKDRRILFFAVAAALIGGIAWFVHARTARQAAGAAKDQAQAANRQVPVIEAVVQKRDVPIFLDGLGSVTLNGIFPSCSGPFPSLRRNDSQRGSEWMLVNRFSTRRRIRLVSCAAAALSSHSNALSASPRKA